MFGKKEKKLLGNTTMLYLMKLSSIIFPLITFPYLTRILGLENYSVLTFVTSLITYFQLLIDFGFLLSATRDIAQNNNNEEEKKKILSGVILAKVILGIFGFIVLFILSLTVKQIRDVKVYAYLSYLATFATIFLPDFLFRGIEKMVGVTMKYITTKSIFTVLVFIFVTKPSHLYRVPLLTFIGELIAIVIIWYFIYFKLKLGLVKVSFKYAFLQLKKSSTFFFSRIATTVYSSTNSLLLGFYFPLTVGIYGVANNIIGTIKGMYGPISDSLYPYMVVNKNFKIVKLVLKIFMPLILVGCLIVFIFSDLVIKIMAGNKYLDASLLLKYMVPLLLITFPSYILGFPTLGALGYVNKANTSVLWASLVHVIGLGLLIAFKEVTFINVIILTCITEGIILFLRVFWIFKAKKDLKSKRLAEEN